MEASTKVSEMVNGASTVMGRRRRSGKKRLNFGPPQQFPRGVRELWTSATVEDQTSAHRACAQILAMWLGKRQREEVARELVIPPLRVWQLSQQALAGMLAGLLHQPKARRANQEMPMTAKDDDPRVLKKRIAELEKQVADHQDLIRLLSSLPKPKSSEPSEPVSRSPAASSKTGARRATAHAERVSGRAPDNTSPAAR